MPEKPRPERLTQNAQAMRQELLTGKTRLV